MTHDNGKRLSESRLVFAVACRGPAKLAPGICGTYGVRFVVDFITGVAGEPANTIRSFAMARAKHAHYGVGAHASYRDHWIVTWLLRSTLKRHYR